MIIGKLKDSTENEYRAQVDKFLQWCEKNYLILNVKKTKEMLIVFRKKETCIQKLTIKEENVEKCARL